MKKVIKSNWFSTECDLPIKHFYSGTKSILHLYHLPGRQSVFDAGTESDIRQCYQFHYHQKIGLEETIIMVALYIGLIYSIRNSC